MCCSGKRVRVRIDIKNYVRVQLTLVQVLAINVVHGPNEETRTEAFRCLSALVSAGLPPRLRVHTIHRLAGMPSAAVAALAMKLLLQQFQQGMGRPGKKEELGGATVQYPIKWNMNIAFSVNIIMNIINPLMLCLTCFSIDPPQRKPSIGCFLISIIAVPCEEGP